jgi:hypothetical protein
MNRSKAVEIENGHGQPDWVHCAIAADLRLFDRSTTKWA